MRNPVGFVTYGYTISSRVGASSSLVLSRSSRSFTTPILCPFYRLVRVLDVPQADSPSLPPVIHDTEVISRIAEPFLSCLVSVASVVFVGLVVFCYNLESLGNLSDNV